MIYLWVYNKDFVLTDFFQDFCTAALPIRNLGSRTYNKNEFKDYRNDVLQILVDGQNKVDDFYLRLTWNINEKTYDEIEYMSKLHGMVYNPEKYSELYGFQLVAYYEAPVDVVSKYNDFITIEHREEYIFSSRYYLSRTNSKIFKYDNSIVLGDLNQKDFDVFIFKLNVPIEIILELMLKINDFKNIHKILQIKDKFQPIKGDINDFIWWFEEDSLGNGIFDNFDLIRHGSIAIPISWINFWEKGEKNNKLMKLIDNYHETISPDFVCYRKSGERCLILSMLYETVNMIKATQSLHPGLFLASLVQADDLSERIFVESNSKYFTEIDVKIRNVSNLSKEDLLIDLAMNAENENIRVKAMKRIKSLKVLEDLELHHQGKHKKYGRFNYYDMMGYEMRARIQKLSKSIKLK